MTPGFHMADAWRAVREGSTYGVTVSCLLTLFPAVETCEQMMLHLVDSFTIIRVTREQLDALAEPWGRPPT